MVLIDALKWASIEDVLVRKQSKTVRQWFLNHPVGRNSQKLLQKKCPQNKKEQKFDFGHLKE